MAMVEEYYDCIACVTDCKASVGFGSYFKVTDPVFKLVVAVINSKRTLLN